MPPIGNTTLRNITISPKITTKGSLSIQKIMKNAMQSRITFLNALRVQSIPQKACAEL